MAARQEWFTAQELAGLPGMPTTDRRVRSLLQKNLSCARPKGTGKGLEYSRSGLPEETQVYLRQQDLAEVLQNLPVEAATALAAHPARPASVTVQAARIPAAPSATPAVPAAPGALALPAGEDAATAAQRKRDLDRRLVLRVLRQLQDAQACSVKQAAQELLRRAGAGELPDALVAKLKGAADERGRKAGTELPSVPTLRRWVRQAATGQSLVPKPSAVADLTVRGWYRPFFALTDRPQKPTLKQAHEQLLGAWRPEWADPPGSPPPSYHAVVRAYNKRSRADRLKGRHTGSALRSRLFFHKRTYEGLQPGTEVHSDGWTTHFTAPCPKTGAYVTYEVWHFHDVATRYVTPLAVGLTENTDVILQGLERCIRVLGVPCIWQTDHTSSVKNARVTGTAEDTHAGLADRLGLTVVHPQAVGNSQANGIAENFNTWLDREARELATYQHPSRMDSGAFVRVRRITNAMVRAADQPAERARLRARAMQLGKGIVFDSHAEALAWLDAKVAKWNNHPHRELPRVRDAATGRLVHLSPQQSLNAALAAGWEPVALTALQLAEEFRPHLKKRVTRGTVTPYGGMRYHHPDLAHHEGEEVLVVVDREHPEQVRVKQLDGRLLAVAGFVAAVGPRTESMAEHTERKRAQAQIKRREQQIGQIEQRLEPAALELAAEPVRLPDPAIFERAAERAAERASGQPREQAPDERLAQALALRAKAAPPQREQPGSVIDSWAQVQQLRQARLAREAAEAAEAAAAEAAAAAAQAPAADGLNQKVAEG